MYKSYKLPLNITKRILMLFLAIWIAFLSVFFSYKEAKAMSAVVGVVSAIGIGKLLTGLAICGTVVAGGIAIEKLVQASPQDYEDFKNGIKISFQDFVAERETAIAKEQNHNLSDQEAADIGVANARNVVNNFFSTAIETTKNTVSGIKAKTIDYWQSFGKEVNDVADNGISQSSGDITSSSTVIPKAIQPTTSNLDLSNPKSALGSDCIEFNGYYYIQSGNFKLYDNGFKTEPFIASTSDNDLYIPYLNILYFEHSGLVQWSYCECRVRKSNNSFVDSYVIRTYSFSDLAQDQNLEVINSIISSSSLPCLISIVNQNGTISNNVQVLYEQGKLSVNSDGVYVPNWKRSIDITLKNTKCGEAISSGRRALVQDGDLIHTRFIDDSYPVKKSSVRAIDEALPGEAGYVGSIGWDLPNDRVWDDVLDGTLPFPRIYDDTGVIQWPKDDTTVRDNDVDVTIPQDTTVDDPADPDDPADDPTMEEWEDTNGGYFYPEAGDLTDIFPFCIPFDIIYLVNQFASVEGQAPVITIPIIYPNSIRAAMGSDRYDVVIDFNDFVVVRNVLRVFILLLFIAGLMKLTRDLIRG